MALKKKLFLVILICPTILFNYWTLKYLDLDNNLSIFTTIIILVFNFVNILIGYIYYKYNFKILFSFTLYLFIIFIISDLSLEKILNKKSIIENDKLLGWTIKPKMDIIFNQETFKRTKYIVNYKSSSERDFREFGNLNSNSKKILVLGDSIQVVPMLQMKKCIITL